MGENSTENSTESATESSMEIPTENNSMITAAGSERRRLLEDSPCVKAVCPFPDALLITEFYYTEKRCKTPAYMAAISQAMAMSSYIEFVATGLIVVLFLRCGYMTTLKPMTLGDHFSIVAEDENREMKDFILKDVDPKIEKLDNRISKLENVKGSSNPKGPSGNVGRVEAADADSRMEGLTAELKRVQESAQALAAKYDAMDAQVEQQATGMQYDKARSETLASESKGVTTPAAEPTSPSSAQGAALRLSASATADSPHEAPPVPKARAYAPA